MKTEPNNKQKHHALREGETNTLYLHVCMYVGVLHTNYCCPTRTTTTTWKSISTQMGKCAAHAVGTRSIHVSFFNTRQDKMTSTFRGDKTRNTRRDRLRRPNCRTQAPSCHNANSNHHLFSGGLKREAQETTAQQHTTLRTHAWQ